MSRRLKLFWRKGPRVREVAGRAVRSILRDTNLRVLWYMCACNSGTFLRYRPRKRNWNRWIYPRRLVADSSHDFEWSCIGEYDLGFSREPAADLPLELVQLQRVLEQVVDRATEDLSLMYEVSVCLMCSRHIGVMYELWKSRCLP